MGDKIDKKLSDDELDQLLEEQFIKESQLIEKELLPDDSGGFGEESEEELEEAYDNLVARLKAEGVYREEDDEDSHSDPRSADTPAAPEAQKEPEEKVVPMPEKKKTGKDKAHKVLKAAGIGLVCVLSVFAASMTSEANRKYFINSVKYWSGDDTRMVIDNDEENELGNKDEYEAREDIEDKLGIEIPRFIYRPEHFSYYNYSVDTINKIANVRYEYDDAIISLCMSKKDEKRKSDNYSLHGEIIKNVRILNEETSASIFVVRDTNDIKPSYVAQWDKEGVFYQFSGKMGKEEFIKLVENMKY